ncbi:MAG: hypothetical protein NTX48_11165 [Planctomycetales bacterium]|nr:hypothetical protein [Planctomycetales bacterium]
MPSPSLQVSNRGLWFTLSQLGAKCRSSRRRQFSTVSTFVEVVEDRRVLSAFTVVNLSDGGQGSLRDAITSANANPGADVIDFQRGLRGTITLTSGEMEITGDLTIQGTGAQRLTISGNNASRIFKMGGAETDVTIDDLTIANGRNTLKDHAGIILTRGGGILNNGGVLRLSRVTMRHNQTIDSGEDTPASDVVGGGAIVNSGHAALTATHCLFIGNVASGGRNYAFGGAIANVTNSTADIQGCIFVSNEAKGGTTSYGGAIGNFGSSQLTVSGCTFRNNVARGLTNLTGSVKKAFGGAIATRPGTIVNSGSITTIADSLFIGNQALGGDTGDAQTGGDSGGGALYSIASHLTVDQSLFICNQAIGGQGGGAGGKASGGAIQATALSSTDLPVTTINTSIFSKNRVIGGAAGDHWGQAAGGALDNSFGQMNVSQCRILNNTAQTRNGANAFGGGFFNGESFNNVPATLNLNNCSVVGNHAQGRSDGNGLGGGIYNGNTIEGIVPVATMRGSRIVANSATGGTTGQGIGGGIYTLGTFNVSGSSPQGNLASTSNKNLFGILTPI